MFPKVRQVFPGAKPSMHTPFSYVNALMSWYDSQSRDLPWRQKGQDHADPYGVWVSEIMLQQTTVAAVLDYYARFMKRFPGVEHLANAPLEDVLHQWQGLGYYSRARNLHKAAQVIVSQYNGAFPACEKNLLALPGVGPYTAAAIASMAYNIPTLPVDGNVARVFARLFTIETPLPQLLVEVRSRMGAFIGHGPHHGDIAQALMDLGATICTPARPACDQCPLRSLCLAYAAQSAHAYPVKAPKKATPHKWATAFVMRNTQGDVYIRQRPEAGLLASLMEVPTTPWETEELSEFSPPVQGAWQRIPKPVTHIFTHFKLTVSVWLAEGVTQEPGLSGSWAPLSELSSHAFPTLMDKIFKSAGIKINTSS